MVFCVAMTHDEKYIIAGDSSNLIHIWNANRRKKVKTLNKHDKCVESVALSHNSKLLVSGSGNIIKIWSFLS